MGNEIIQANYPDLEGIATKFGSLNEAASAMQSQIRSAFEPLQGGGWIGRGASAFFAEMDSEMFPAIDRMIQALEAGRAVTTELSTMIRQAEEEAAGIYKNGDGFGGGAGGGAFGGAGGGSGSAGTGAAGSGNVAGDGTSSSGPSGGISGVLHGSNTKGSDPSKGVGVNLVHGSLYSTKAEGEHGSAELKLGRGSAGLRFGKDSEGRTVAGGYAEVSAAEASANGRIGSKDYGVTGGVRGRVLSAEATAGYRDGTFGATIGGNLASVKGEVGTNIAGKNVSVNGEIGAKLELGLQIGKNTKVKLGPVSFGISFGGGK